MNQPILTLNGFDVTLGAAGLAFAVAVLALLVAIAVLAARGSRRRRDDTVRQERQDEAMEKRIARPRPHPGGDRGPAPGAR
jgi:hypothetical protein